MSLQLKLPGGLPGRRYYARQSQNLGRRTDLLEATGSATKELIKGRNLAKYIAPSATTNAAPQLVLIRDNYVLRCVYVLMAAMVQLCIREIGARSFNGRVDNR